MTRFRLRAGDAIGPPSFHTAVKLDRPLPPLARADFHGVGTNPSTSFCVRVSAKLAHSPELLLHTCRYQARYRHRELRREGVGVLLYRVFSE